eukprot:3564238-Amphidinium_carterae.1
MHKPHPKLQMFRGERESKKAPDTHKIGDALLTLTRAAGSAGRRSLPTEPEPAGPKDVQSMLSAEEEPDKSQ